MSRRHTPPSRRSQLDLAAVTLLRLVSVRDWGPERAALDLRAALHDDRALLHLLRARVALAMMDRPTHTDERAFATLDLAIGEPGLSRAGTGAVLPRQRMARD
jgi:hypothetical protein